MSEDYKFVDQTGVTPDPIDLWPATVIPKEALDAEIERLASLPRPANGRRRSLIAHPRAGRGNGLAAGIQVALDVLLPGERTEPFRTNATQVNFCIHGAGHSMVGGKHTDFAQFDVWNSPSMHINVHSNTSSQVQVRLTYSNAALLEQMNVYYFEENPKVAEIVEEESADEKSASNRKNPFGTFQLNDGGAWMMPYEILINPPSVESKSLHWPWLEVKEHLDKLEALGADYVGRRLYLLYNPMTGRSNGTTPSFFATMTRRPAKIVDRPHRHTSAAINYYFQGSGYSTVEGKVYQWKAGDLMLSAPGWAVHNHASNDEHVYELTVQDQPLNIMMESLLWQESLKHPFSVLGQQEGFGTNRAKVG